MAATRPTAAAGANAGTSPPAPVISNFCNDENFTVTFGTGTTPAAGAQCVVTLSGSWSGYTEAPVPVVVASSRNAATAALQLYADISSDARQVTIGFASAPAASQANTVYSVAVQIEG